MLHVFHGQIEAFRGCTTGCGLIAPVPDCAMAVNDVTSAKVPVLQLGMNKQGTGTCDGGKIPSQLQLLAVMSCSVWSGSGIVDLVAATDAAVACGASCGVAVMHMLFAASTRCTSPSESISQVFSL